MLEQPSRRQPHSFCNLFSLLHYIHLGFCFFDQAMCLNAPPLIDSDVLAHTRRRQKSSKMTRIAVIAAFWLQSEKLPVGIYIIWRTGLHRYRQRLSTTDLQRLASYWWEPRTWRHLRALSTTVLKKLASYRFSIWELSCWNSENPPHATRGSVRGSGAYWFSSHTCMNMGMRPGMVITSKGQHRKTAIPPGADALGIP